MTRETITKITCDVCGNEIHKKLPSFKMTATINTMNPDYHFNYEDVCLDCSNKIKKFIKKMGD